MQWKGPVSSPTATARVRSRPFERPDRVPRPVCGVRQTSSFPFSTASRSQSAPEPLLKTQQYPRRFALPEIAKPTPQIAGQLLSHSFDTHTSGPARQFPNSLFEPVYRFRRYPPFRFPPIRKSEPKKLPLPWPRHCTLQFIHLELEPRCEESLKAFHHPFSDPLTANIDIAIVRISRKPQPAPLQLLVKLVKHNVAEQWR